LGAPFTWHEIERAINNAPSNRSPGPDGFTNEFYKFYKTEMKDELMELFQSLYDRSIRLDGLNLASIVLLSKKEHTSQITDYRPVSLQHSIPKLIAKVLANRLQPKMKQPVQEMQSGFIKDRSIVENFAAAIEMIQCSNKLRRPVIVLKLDFQKAFDIVHWEAILATLAARGFPERWTWWVKHLLETSRAQILLNGQLGKKFKIEKGVHQGDPLSPYLYIVVADVLQQMIRRADREGLLLHPIENGAPLHVLQYADDTLLILHGTPQQATLAKALLDAIAMFTGLHINYQKSTFVPLHTSEDVFMLIANTLGCNISSLPCTYLGLPLSMHKISRLNIQPVIQRIGNRLPGWMPRMLGSGGRIQMINSVISAIPNFFMACILWDAASIETINKLTRAFLWKNKKDIHGGHCLLAWDIVTLPKEQGGLGIRNLAKHNQALMANLAAKLLSGGAGPCFQWLSRWYLQNQIPESPTTQDTPFWKSMIKHITLVQSTTKCKANSGKTTAFWNDVWTERGKF
jgi:hypothetical protein